MKLHYLSAGILLSLCSIGCNRSSQGDPSDPVIQVSDDNARMNTAIAKAKATVPQFIKVLASKDKSCTELAIKHGFRDGEAVEHMWVGDLKYDGQKFTGTMNNIPNQVSNVKSGDTVSIDKSEISDWMYIQHGKLVGGYTIRALRDDLSPAEKKSFDSDLPFKVD